MTIQELYPTPDIFKHIEIGKDIYGQQFKVGDVVVLPHTYIEPTIQFAIGEYGEYFSKQKIDNNKQQDNRQIPEPFFEPVIDNSQFDESDKYTVAIDGLTPVLVPLGIDYKDHQYLNHYRVLDERTRSEYVGNKGMRFVDNPNTDYYAVRLIQDDSIM